MYIRLYFPLRMVCHINCHSLYTCITLHACTDIYIYILPPNPPPPAFFYLNSNLHTLQYTSLVKLYIYIVYTLYIYIYIWLFIYTAFIPK